jgi:hypothetical protein
MHSRGMHRRRLGMWLANQRQLYRDGMLDEQHARQLEQLPGWQWDGGLAGEHVAMVQALRVFSEFEKHADVPEDHVEDGLQLGRWCWAIRRARVLGELPPALFDEVSAAAPRTHKGASVFPWYQAEAQWRLMYAALRQYATREGHPVAPTSHVEAVANTKANLGQWCALQRFRYRHGDLDPKYTDWLNAVPGWKWEVPLGTKEIGEPIDLGGHRHGTAKGIQAKCPCEECVEAARRSGRAWLAKRRQVIDGVPAGLARHHINRLEQAGVKRTAIVAVSRVPLGVIRKVASGDWTSISRTHEAAIIALTVEQCEAVNTVVGSRGRLITAENERIDAAPTWAILDDLARRGFTKTWVARELGYSRGLQIRRDVVSRRIADSIADIAHRVGSRRAPATPRTVSPPTLAELLAAETTGRAA